MILFMKNGLIKAAAAAPKLRVADPAYNLSEMLRVAQRAEEAGVRVLVFPELCLTGVTCGDLFFSETLLNGAAHALSKYLTKTAALDMVSVVGLPLIWQNTLCNTAAVCHAGKLLGIVPKSTISPRSPTNEARHFSVACASDTINFDGTAIPFGTDLVFTCNTLPSLKLAVEVGEAFTASPTATLVCKPTASVELPGEASRRRVRLEAFSREKLVSYIYASAGEGESTTDLVFGGHRMIWENGTLLAESAPLSCACELAVSEIDVELLTALRRQSHMAEEACRTVGFSPALQTTKLTRPIAKNPFLPKEPTARASYCETILDLQAAGLKQRIERAFVKKLVIGISGGLDSTLALLVAVRAIDALKRPRTDIITVTMPGFGTTKRTKSNAEVLCEELGTDFRCVSISKAVEVHFKDIGHDPAERNVTYENAQARERTQVLMDIANDCGGMVIGTGDLSELVLGWATYNGDHMSMYAVNASVPKTAVREVVAHYAARCRENGEKKLAEALFDVLGTPVSPELLPADGNGEIAQKTEDLVGPYEIHDFYLYYLLRYGFAPSKLYRLAVHALGEDYDSETLKKWLKVLLRRFFNQQFKRSCMPDGPKVTDIGVSPRGEWQMPSDASSALWLEKIDLL